MGLHRLEKGGAQPLVKGLPSLGKWVPSVGNAIPIPRKRGSRPSEKRFTSLCESVHMPRQRGFRPVWKMGSHPSVKGFPPLGKRVDILRKRCSLDLLDEVRKPWNILRFVVCPLTFFIKSSSFVLSAAKLTNCFRGWVNFRILRPRERHCDTTLAVNPL